MLKPRYDRLHSRLPDRMSNPGTTDSWLTEHLILMVFVSHNKLFTYVDKIDPPCDIFQQDTFFYSTGVYILL
jgi:hypothetical protein